MITALSLLLFTLALIPFLVTLRNLRCFFPPPMTGTLGPGQGVSVLVPARNEGHQIEACLNAVLVNEGVPFEIRVFDDDSDDDTAERVKRIIQLDGRVHLVRSTGLPPGWNGKQFACYQLALEARYPWLLFLDADVRLTSDALFRSLLEVERSQAVLVSGLPHQESVTWSERCFIPFIHFLLLGFLPLWRMRRSTHPCYSAGCGQYILAERAAYHRVGGHSLIPASRHDGLKLPKAFREAGYLTDLFDASPLASCRMYGTAGGVIRGFTKNATEGLARGGLLPWVTLVLGGGQLGAWILLIGWGQSFSPLLILVLLGAIMVTFAHRGILAWRFRQHWTGVPLHPPAILALLALQWWAWWRKMIGGPAPTWKGRGDPRETGGRQRGLNQF